MGFEARYQFEIYQHCLKAEQYQIMCLRLGKSSSKQNVWALCKNTRAEETVM